MSRKAVRLARGVAASAFPVAMLLMLVILVILVMAGPVAAQTPTPTPSPTPSPITPPKPVPLPWFVVDARGGFASLGSDVETASDLGVLGANMPGRALTAVVGAHLYLVRRGGFKLGVGAEMMRGAGSNQPIDSTGQPVGPVIRRRLNAVSGQLSLNFGKGRGWSYITVGSGPLKFESYLNDASPTTKGDTTLNYGGGARWFTKTHLAFTVDLRFYLTRPVPAAPDTVARGRQRVTLLSAGISLK